MKKTKFICGAVTAMMLGAAVPASAEEITAILYSENNQELASAPILTDYAITFAQDGINVLNGDKQLVATMPYEGAWSIQFMGVNAGVDQISVEKSFRLKENPVDAILEVVGYNEGVTTLRIYDMAGKMRIVDNNWDGNPVDVTALSPGMYLLSINNTTIKFIKK